MIPQFDRPVVILSSDIDWASEACIEDAFEFASRYGIKPSYFVTHESAVLRRLHEADRAELGLHPNFLPNSSHGDSQEEVIEFVRRLVPSARGFRSHGFVDSTAITRQFKETGFVWDSNLCLYLQDGIVPLRHCSGLVRFPVFWADDVHWTHRPNDWGLEHVLKSFLSPGLKIIDVHPIHLALNTPDASFYADYRAQTKSLTGEQILASRHTGPGVRTFLEALIPRLQQADVHFCNFEGIYRVVADWEEGAVLGDVPIRDDRQSAEVPSC